MKLPVNTLEQLFRALSDDTRLRILALLGSSEICVCHIHEALDVPQPTASRHLAYLRRSGLVATRRQGLWIYYRVAVPADPKVASVLSATLQALDAAARIGEDRDRLRACCAIEPKPVALRPVVSPPARGAGAFPEFEV